MTPSALAILAPVLSLAVGMMLGAWMYHCGTKGQSPIPSLPALPRRKKKDAAVEQENYPQQRSAHL